MDYTNTSQRDKKAVLEHAALSKSPEEISALYQQLGHVENSARALGLACRFRGLENVRALVAGGADFSYIRPKGEGGYYTIDYWMALLDLGGILRMAVYLPHFNKGDACFWDKITDVGKTYTVLPLEKRIEVMEYLCQHSGEVCLDTGELLFYSIMGGCMQITKALHKLGVRLSEKRITGITEDGRSVQWREFCAMLDCLGDEEYLEVAGSIVRETGGKTFYYTDAVYWGNYDPDRGQFRLYKPEFFRFILEHFNQKKMNKKQFMQGAVDQNSVACLKICAENRWLDMPRKRDEIINYASAGGSVECLAWLLEYKKRTANFAAEREKAEKRVMRELNAAPDSVLELKKVWGYERRRDGTIIITRYKGTRTEIAVPEKIGGSAVTAIGAKAFSPKALRLREEQEELRRAITRITLPGAVEMIGDSAFEGCHALVEINIPDRVTAINTKVFADCRALAAVRIPDGVRTIKEDAFSGCKSLRSIKLPEGITEIANGVFGTCVSLQSVTIPRTVTTIGKYAFWYCMALESVVIPEGVLEIGQLAFRDCTKLKSVVLPRSVQKIKNYTNNRAAGPATVFLNDENVTVTVVPKSYAERYCRRNDIRYVYGEDE